MNNQILIELGSKEEDMNGFQSVLRAMIEKPGDDTLKSLTIKLNFHYMKKLLFLMEKIQKFQ